MSSLHSLWSLPYHTENLYGTKDKLSYQVLSERLNAESRVRKKDEGYTNIRIRTETREELRAIGTYSENMDDIVRKCLVAYKTITNSGGKVINKIVVEEPIGTPEQQLKQQQRQPQQTHAELFIPLKKDEFLFKLDIPALVFPVNKGKLIEYADKDKPLDRGSIPAQKIIGLQLIGMLPETNKVYRSKEELETALEKVIRNESNMYLRMLRAQGFPDRKIVGVKLNDDPSQYIEDVWVKGTVTSQTTQGKDK
jgi:hypothetical protein